MANVFQTSTLGEANLRVAIVDTPGMADLWVHKVATMGLACGDALWFMTETKGEAKVWVYYCSIGMSQLKVCFVPTKGMAGWQNEHPLNDKIGSLLSQTAF